VLVPLGAVVAVGVLLKRLPIRTSSSNTWPIDDLSAGAGGARGQIVIAGGSLLIEVAGVTRVVPVATITTAVADGECLRLGWEAPPGQALLLPRGTPDTPAGRRAQSRALEGRLRGTLPAANLVR
jgi:hypothetical protein